jgi:hypothetical protein
LNILRRVMKRAKRELQLPFDATEGIPAFDTSEHPAYTEEAPNTLTAEEAAVFLDRLKAEFPAQYAMTFLGFATGLRPSTMRPLRRARATPDVLWEQGAILVRRSHTVGEEVMNTTRPSCGKRITSPIECASITPPSPPMSSAAASATSSVSLRLCERAREQCVRARVGRVPHRVGRDLAKWGGRDFVAPKSLVLSCRHDWD